MSLTEEVSFDKEGRIERFPLFRKLFLTLVIILVAVIAFGIGRLSVVGNREPIKIEYNPEMTNAQGPMTNENSAFIVASKNSSKYHYAYCPGARQISEKNKLTFATPAAAEAAGYILASNCKAR